ncbi:general odorant-binding protein 71 [Euwallacea fornicatus]|uniref:general odorant-binding protein 71 n=1 Tax=Euwallacea fornicatus TaxID=995702 RepID=UPI00338DFE4F
MKLLYVLLLVVLLTEFNQALQCGVSRLNNEQFRKVLAECVKDNQTFGDILNLASDMSGDESEDGGSDSSASSDEEPPATRVTPRTVSQSSIRNNLKATFMRSNRARRSGDSNNQKSRNSFSNVANTEATTPMENQGKANDVGASGEICTWQCIFEKLELSDSNGLPDHYKFASSIVNSASRRETRDFLQETVDECFQMVAKTDSANPCEFSSKLTGCLAEKGRTNCEDWPTGNIPF